MKHFKIQHEPEHEQPAGEPREASEHEAGECTTGSQCNDLRTGVICSHVLVFVRTLAAEF